jgi:hypothetical protein
MATNNSSNNQFTNDSDGFDISGGTTKRKLTVTAGDVTLSGGGSNTYTLPAATDTLVGRASTDTLTNKNLASSTNTFPYQTGWSYTTVSGSQNTVNTTVTFPVPFATPPIVIAQLLGYKTGTAPTSITDFTGNIGTALVIFTYITNISTTGFIMYTNSYGGNMGASYNGFTWSAHPN